MKGGKAMGPDSILIEYLADPFWFAKMARKSKKTNQQEKQKTNQQEKLEYEKRMESFRSLLSYEVNFMLPAMMGISNLDKLSAEKQAALLWSFLAMGHIGTLAILLSHAHDAKRWSAVVSAMTVMVTVFWLGIFHLVMGLVIPVADQELCVLINIALFLFVALVITWLWKSHFKLPEAAAKDN